MEGINKIIALIVVVLVVILGLGYVLGRFKTPTQKQVPQKKSSLGGVLGGLLNDDKNTPTPTQKPNTQTITGVVSNTGSGNKQPGAATPGANPPSHIPDTGATDILFILPLAGIGYALKKSGGTS